MVEIEEVVTKDPRRFLEMLGKIGSKKSPEIPMEVYDENGSIRSVINSVLGKWKTDYDNLYNGCTSDKYDKKFYEDSMRNLNNREANGYIISGLNHDITEDEVRRVIFNSKSRKATGIENLPNEILKNDNTVVILTKLFSKIFNTGIMPTIWKTAIIKPIPKSAMVDPRLPLQYRGISLLSTVYKLFSSL